mgnify:CR=1 FL=1
MAPFERRPWFHDGGCSVCIAVGALVKSSDVLYKYRGSPSLCIRRVECAVTMFHALRVVHLLVVYIVFRPVSHELTVQLSP